jgi:uncharacterized protein
MLIRFRVSNYLSFKDVVEFSMIPGRTKQHPKHVISNNLNNDINLLRAGIVYGANAAGKSNLVKAIWFAKNFILDGFPSRKVIPVTPFKLDKASLQQPSKFEFEIRIDGVDYLYGFEVDPEKVCAEWLHTIRKSTTVPLFERITDSQGKTHVEFSNMKLGKKELEKLAIYGEGTPPTKSFLAESVERNRDVFKNVYEWFKKLVVIYPESRYDFITLDIIGKKTNINTNVMVDYLKKSGTGVCGFDTKRFSPDTEIPREVLADISKDLKPGEKASLIDSSEGNRYLISKDDQGEIVANKLMLKHKMADSDDDALFEPNEESDGTIRLMDLSPIVTNPDKEAGIYIIDELDRSLHPILCYQLIQDFLEKSSNSQLIVTTHESNLLNFNLLRRDEIWFVEKDQRGATALYSLEEFTPRYDRDIQKGYLLGRFGAIPILGKKFF